MKRKIPALRILGCAVLGLAFATTASAQTLKLPPHEKVVLKNGLTLLLMEKHEVPMVSLAAIVKAGTVADPVASRATVRCGTRPQASCGASSGHTA